MSGDAGNKDKPFYLKSKWLIFTSVVFLFVLFILLSNHGILKRISVERQKSDIFSKIESEKRAYDSIRKRINMLEYDTLEIERIAREKFGMAKPGEKIYYIPRKK